MKCNFCNDKATVFLEQLVAGNAKKMSLCSSCAEEKGMTNPENFSLDSVFESSQQEQETVNEAPDLLSDMKHGLPSVTEMDLVCDHCGFTITDLKKIGRLGCSECYPAFRMAMAPMLESMHKGVTHLGRSPEGRIDSIRQQEELKMLNTKLKKAVGAEHYEQAVELRDKIRELKVAMEEAL